MKYRAHQTAPTACLDAKGICTGDFVERTESQAAGRQA